MHLPDATTMPPLLSHFNPGLDRNVLLTVPPDSGRSPAFAKVTIAILVPEREQLHLHLRLELGRVRYRGTIHSPQHLLDQVSDVPAPSVLVLAGIRMADRVSAVILPHRELYVVPDAWLSHITSRDVTRRARTAARIVHAHLVDPVQLRLSPFDDDDVPY